MKPQQLLHLLNYAINQEEWNHVINYVDYLLEDDLKELTTVTNHQQMLKLQGRIEILTMFKKFKTSVPSRLETMEQDIELQKDFKND
jgi:hypothetical protein